MTDYTKLIDDAIDYNASDERPRATLQSAIEVLQSERDHAMQDSQHWVDKHLALAAENERLKREIQNQYRCIESHAKITQKAEAERDALQSQDGPCHEDGPDSEGFSGPRPWNNYAAPKALGRWSVKKAEDLAEVLNERGEQIAILYAAEASRIVDAHNTAPKALAPTTWQPASNPPPESAGEVLVRMADGRCEIAWPTYWHGSSNAFAQWTFRDPDETEQPVEWMTIPAHGVGGTPT